MARTKLTDFCASKGYNMASPVRANTNGYKYITLLDANDPGEPENIYLGVRYSESVKVGDKLPIRELFVAETLNATGESRLKLTNKEGNATAKLIANGYSAF